MPDPKSKKIRPNRKKKIKVREMLAYMGGFAAGSVGGYAQHERQVIVPDEHEHEEPRLSLLGALITLAVFTALLGFHTEFATNSLTAFLPYISSTFIGIVLLPIFSIDPGCVTTGSKDKQSANLENTLGKCLQIALVVTPLVILIGWIMDISEMTLLFTNFDVGILFTSVLIINYITARGKSNW
jgi:Ca2+:H+ antiporter